MANWKQHVSDLDAEYPTDVPGCRQSHERAVPGAEPPSQARLWDAGFKGQVIYGYSPPFDELAKQALGGQNIFPIIIVKVRAAHRFGSL